MRWIVGRAEGLEATRIVAESEEGLDGTPAMSGGKPRVLGT
jgi:hypothetical protein